MFAPGLSAVVGLIAAYVVLGHIVAGTVMATRDQVGEERVVAWSVGLGAALLLSIVAFVAVDFLLVRP